MCLTNHYEWTGVFQLLGGMLVLLAKYVLWCHCTCFQRNDNLPLWWGPAAKACPLSNVCAHHVWNYVQWGCAVQYWGMTLNAKVEKRHWPMMRRWSCIAYEPNITIQNLVHGTNQLVSGPHTNIHVHVHVYIMQTMYSLAWRFCLENVDLYFFISVAHSCGVWR